MQVKLCFFAFEGRRSLIEILKLLIGPESFNHNTCQISNLYLKTCYRYTVYFPIFGRRGCVFRVNIESLHTKFSVLRSYYLYLHRQQNMDLSTRLLMLIKKMNTLWDLLRLLLPVTNVYREYKIECIKKIQLATVEQDRQQETLYFLSA